MLLPSIEVRPGAYQQITTSPHWRDYHDTRFFSVGTHSTTENRVSAIPKQPDNYPDLSVEVRHRQRDDLSRFSIHTFTLDNHDQITDRTQREIVVSRSDREYDLPVTTLTSLDTVFDWIQQAIRQHENRLRQHTWPSRFSTDALPPSFYVPMDILSNWRKTRDRQR